MQAFSTGADISGADAHEHFDVSALDRANRIIRAITRLDKPVVAAVNGIAAGVGCSAALAADVVVAAESASFLLAFARIGLMPDGGATATVAASIGRARAMRMALLAEPLTAREAYDAGLVTHVAPDADFPDLVSRLVARLAAGPPLALAASKKAVNAATLPHLDDALERERTGQTVLLRHLRRRRGHAGVLREAEAGVPRGVRSPRREVEPAVALVDDGRLLRLM